MQTRLQSLIESVVNVVIGYMVALAERLGIHRVAVYQWRRVPEAHVREVGEILHIAKNRLRPDLYD